MSRKQKSAALAAALVVASVAVGTVAGAGTADAGKLPGASGTKKVGGGKVTIRLFDEYSSIQRAVTNVPTSREVWLSGKVKVTTAGDIKGATVTPGYLVGCQLSFNAGMGSSIGVTTDEDSQLSTTVNVPTQNGTVPIEINTPIDDSSGASAKVKIKPGQVKFQPVINANVGGDVTNSFTFTNGVGGVTYSQQKFGVDGCAGFAEARAIVNVKVSTDDFKGNITLYGKPFSIG